jgi:benzoyl-CoA reductase/2-hydroxyglutaryl-CoA dehydratase subunit BcrC/BadD/HgdB
MTQTPEKELRKITAAKKMRDIMTTYYLEALSAAQNNRQVAWITSGGSGGTLVAMDIIPVYPENHGAMIGSAKMGEDLCAKAEDMGYCADLCSYARADIGCAVAGWRSHRRAAPAGHAHLLQQYLRHGAQVVRDPGPVL